MVTKYIHHKINIIQTLIGYLPVRRNGAGPDMAISISSMRKLQMKMKEVK